jgi:hypothetical protein
MVENHSFKATDPISSRFEINNPQRKLSIPFECSLISKADVERRFVLPAEREISRSLKHYHSQLGLSMQSTKKIVPRITINDSQSMRHSIQYADHPFNKSLGSLDDFKYSSRK